MRGTFTAYLITEDDKVKNCDLFEICKKKCSLTKDSDGVRCPKCYWGVCGGDGKEKIYTTEIEI